MKREDFLQLADIEKYWYLKGYLDSMIDSISIEMKLPKKEVTKWVVNRLQAVIEI